MFEDKIVLITGGGGGIGRAAAERFLAEGAPGGAQRHPVRGAGRRAAGARPGGRAHAARAGPVHTRADARALVAAAVERFGGVDVLVNSTGIFAPIPFAEQTEDDLEEALGSILRPTFWAAQAVVPSMRERGGGAIVNVGSMWAIDAIATTPTSAYSAAQAGRHALTKNLAIELAAEGIRVNTVALRSSRRPPTGASWTRRRPTPCSRQ